LKECGQIDKTNRLDDTVVTDPTADRPIEIVGHSTLRRSARNGMLWVGAQ